jgi:hypothetical protein
VSTTDDIIELADTELAAAAHRVYAHGAIAGWTVGDYEAALDRTKICRPRGTCSTRHVASSASSPR